MLTGNLSLTKRAIQHEYTEAEEDDFEYGGRSLHDDA